MLMGLYSITRGACPPKKILPNDENAATVDEGKSFNFPPWYTCTAMAMGYLLISVLALPIGIFLYIMNHTMNNRTLKNRVRHALCEILRHMVANKERLVISRNGNDTIVYVGSCTKQHLTFAEMPPDPDGEITGAIANIVRSRNPSSVYHGVEIVRPPYDEVYIERAKVYLYLAPDAYMKVLIAPRPPSLPMYTGTLKFPLWSRRSHIGRYAQVLVGQPRHNRNAHIKNFLEDLVLMNDCGTFPIG